MNEHIPTGLALTLGGKSYQTRADEQREELMTMNAALLQDNESLRARNAYLKRVIEAQNKAARRGV